MPGRTPPQADQNYIGPLQRALSCVTPAVVNVRGGYRAGIEHALVLGNGDFQTLQGVDLAIWVGQRYRIIEATGPAGPWKVTTTGYSYHLVTGEERQVLRYDWHPATPDGIDFPHLHLGAALGAIMPRVQEAHLPTGRVSVEQVVQMLITELGASPLRDDWQEVLDETGQAFDEWRTW